MDAEPIDGARALALLREVVGERPDYVYRSPVESGCVYLHDGQPSCMVGHAWVRNGGDLAVLRRMDSGSYGAIRFRDIQPDAMTREAASIFAAAQAVQDRSVLSDGLDSYTWGDALAAAEIKARLLGVTP